MDRVNELRELYHEQIRDHNTEPRNYREIPEARRVDAINPLCGDELSLFVRVEDGIIRDAAFLGVGCAISRASASMLTEAVRGRSCAEAEVLSARFRALVTGLGSGDGGAAGEAQALGKLAAFAGVRAFASRVKCATLAWHALDRALASDAEAPGP